MNGICPISEIDSTILQFQMINWNCQTETANNETAKQMNFIFGDTMVYFFRFNAIESIFPIAWLFWNKARREWQKEEEAEIISSNVAP